MPHHTGWSRLFAQEAERLRNALGASILSIEHVGSTAVPGLAAKPILDIAASVPNLDEAASLIGAIEHLGYVHKPDPEVPDRLYFVRGGPELRTHHLSLAEPGSTFWREHLLFRDLLRAHPHVALEYSRLKHELAASYPHDRRAYTEGKSAFVRGVLNRNLSLAPSPAASEQGPTAFSGDVGLL